MEVIEITIQINKIILTDKTKETTEISQITEPINEIMEVIEITEQTNKIILTDKTKETT